MVVPLSFLWGLNFLQATWKCFVAHAATNDLSFRGRGVSPEPLCPRDAQGPGQALPGWDDAAVGAGTLLCSRSEAAPHTTAHLSTTQSDQHKSYTSPWKQLQNQPAHCNFTATWTGEQAQLATTVLPAMQYKSFMPCQKWFSSCIDSSSSRSDLQPSSLIDYFLSALPTPLLWGWLEWKAYIKHLASQGRGLHTGKNQGKFDSLPTYLSACHVCKPH